jgi:hypothetical protein
MFSILLLLAVFRIINHIQCLGYCAMATQVMLDTCLREAPQCWREPVTAFHLISGWLLVSYLKELWIANRKGNVLGTFLSFVAAAVFVLVAKEITIGEVGIALAENVFGGWDDYEVKRVRTLAGPK